jgi:hypothetical protein
MFSPLIGNVPRKPANAPAVPTGELIFNVLRRGYFKSSAEPYLMRDKLRGITTLHTSKRYQNPPQYGGMP